MALASGMRLGPYELLSALGAGGMGEVWKARDTRLNRLVAIKVSQTAFSDRFDREARAIAAVNHPHVCALYDAGLRGRGGRSRQTTRVPTSPPTRTRDRTRHGTRPA